MSFHDHIGIAQVDLPMRNGSNMIVVKVDCDSYQEECINQDVTFYPTFNIYVDGSLYTKYIEVYKGVEMLIV